MVFAIDGLASGMNTTSIINALIDVEALPQSILKSKVSGHQSLVTALQALNSKIASLATLAFKTTTPSGLTVFTASSSSPSVLAVASDSASAGSTDIVVDKLAQTHTGVTKALAGWPVSPPVITLVDSAGVKTEITASSASLDDVVSAVNAAGVGVTAMKVASGTDPATGEQLYRLQFTSKTSGAAGSFTAYRGSIAEVDAGTATDLFTETGGALVKQGQDAELRLWPGTTAEQTITSATNTFKALLPGVDVTVSEASATPVTITVARDGKAVSAKAEELVKALNEVFDFVAAKSAVSTAGAGQKVLGGVFLGDSTVRAVNGLIFSAVSTPVNGKSPSEIGIVITKHGNLTFDAAKFEKAYAADPVQVESTLREISAQVEKAAKTGSDKYTGLVTSKITGQETLMRDLNDQILDWDGRLASRRSTLERIFSAMEVRLNNMNSQSAWLSSQLASLPQGTQEK